MCVAMNLRHLNTCALIVAEHMKIIHSNVLERGCLTESQHHVWKSSIPQAQCGDTIVQYILDATISIVESKTAP